MKELLPLLDKPKIVAVIAETNQGKSNLLYSLIEALREDYSFTLATYGLRCPTEGREIHSLEEMEGIRDSIILLDEFETLFDVEDRKNRRSIENSLRLINHNNNIIILCGLPDNFKKFLSNKINMFIFKTCRIGNFINGSRAKAVCLAYRGEELGATSLSLPLDAALVFTESYTRIKVPYLEKYDTKRNNKPIVSKNVQKKNVPNCAVKNVQKTYRKASGSLAK